MTFKAEFALVVSLIVVTLILSNWREGISLATVVR